MNKTRRSRRIEKRGGGGRVGGSEVRRRWISMSQIQGIRNEATGRNRRIGGETVGVRSSGGGRG